MEGLEGAYEELPTYSPPGSDDEAEAMAASAGPATPEAIKLGVVYLGRVLGKHKFTLLEEEDITFVRGFALQAHVDVNRDGEGARVFAMAQLQGASPAPLMREIYFHELLWLHHKGQIRHNHRIVHRNGITVDNRMSNLHELPLDPHTGAPILPSLSPAESETQERSALLYRIAISQLPPMNVRQEFSPVNIDANGLTKSTWEEDLPLFECRKAACTHIEKHVNEFLVCRHCRVARYCSADCQASDWLEHKRDCEHEAETCPVWARIAPKGIDCVR